MGFGLAEKDGPTEGQGALTEVRQILPSNAFVPAVAEFRISTPLVEGLSKLNCTGGFPVTRFPRTMFPSAPEARMMPFTFPTIVLSSIVLLLSPAAIKPMPKLPPWAR